MTPHPTRWVLRPSDPADVRVLQSAAGLHPVVARILANRGVTGPAAAANFLDSRLTALHDPSGLPGVVEAAEVIVAAIRAGRKITVYGDYDVDGVTATTVLWGMLRAAGARCDYYIPSRFEEGYGLNRDALDALKAAGTDLVVTVDCGISALDQARHARAIGLDLIITDHHHIGDELPEALAVVHPRLPGSYPFGDLCGAAVGFKLAWQVARAFGDGAKASPAHRDYLMEALGLVGMATIADMMPMHGENRVLVRHGLEALGRSPSAGLKALLKVAGHKAGRPVGATTIGFQLGPRINAAGRMARAATAVELLSTTDGDAAARLARDLEDCNVERKALQEDLLAEAHAMVQAQGGLGDRGAIVLGRAGWHPGVVGIAAGRLADTYHRPAIVVVLDDELGHGSARSVAGFNLVQALETCREGLIGFGGHAAAAGVRVARRHYPDWGARFDDHCRAHLTAEQMLKELLIDAEVGLKSLSWSLVEDMGRLEPYGIANPRPLLAAHGLRLAEDPRPVGATKTHVQFRLEQEGKVVKGIGFSMAARVKTLREGDLVSIAFEPTINEFAGRRTVEVEVKDIKLTGS
jgi:single-stranded-DNA-specific exonuclease